MSCVVITSNTAGLGCSLRCFDQVLERWRNQAFSSQTYVPTLNSIQYRSLGIMALMLKPGITRVAPSKP